MNQDINPAGNHLSIKEKESKYNFLANDQGIGLEGRIIPTGFYISHQRKVKRTHFKDVYDRKLAELLEAFHIFDFDRDGVISHEDLKKTFASLCVDVDGEEIDKMLSEGLSPLNFDAFVILLGCRTMDLDPEEVVLDALSNWDNYQEGLVSQETLKLHLMAWGDKFTEEEVTAALADAPLVITKTKEKMIDYVQFSEDLCGLRKMIGKNPNPEEKCRLISLNLSFRALSLKDVLATPLASSLLVNVAVNKQCLKLI